MFSFILNEFLSQIMLDCEHHTKPAVANEQGGSPARCDALVAHKILPRVSLSSQKIRDDELAIIPHHIFFPNREEQKEFNDPPN